MSSLEMLFKKLDEEIVLLDGAMGTMIQHHKLQEEDYRGERFKSWHTLIQGNNDLLTLTQPQIIRDIHKSFLEAGADVVMCARRDADAPVEAAGRKGVATLAAHLRDTSNIPPAAELTALGPRVQGGGRAPVRAGPAALPVPQPERRVAPPFGAHGRRAAWHARVPAGRRRGRDRRRVWGGGRDAAVGPRSAAD